MHQHKYQVSLCWSPLCLTNCRAHSQGVQDLDTQSTQQDEMQLGSWPQGASWGCFHHQLNRPRGSSLDLEGSFILNLFKGKGTALNQGQLLWSQVIGWSKVLDVYIHKMVNIVEMQSSFFSGEGTAYAIFTVCQQQEKYNVANKPLYIAFVDPLTSLQLCAKEGPVCYITILNHGWTSMDPSLHDPSVPGFTKVYPQFDLPLSSVVALHVCTM